MSSSDYTTLKKLNYLNNCTSNVQNTCYTYQNPPNCSSYYISCAADTDCSNNTTCNTVATCDTTTICKQDTFSSTIEEVLITPSVNGAVTFTVCKNLSFTLGLPVTVSSSTNLNNYFEGFIYDYDKCSGNITVNKIQYISGIFTAPSIYLINVTNNITELNSLRNQITQLYALLDGSGNTNLLLNQQNLDVIELYYYFFNQDIRQDSDYVLSETYLNSKMNYLYLYFFDINIMLSSNSGWNPNNSSVQLNTLTNKISQMYIYFFGTYTSSFTIVTM
jgi:hypothetical protein